MLRLDVDIQPQVLELVLGIAECRCLDGLEFRIGDRVQYQPVFAALARRIPQYGALPLGIIGN
jgi:hypothetical protein